MRYLGIDFGTKRIGLAVGDDELKIVSPLCVVADLAKVIDIIKTEDIEKIVIGNPVTMRSEDGEMVGQVAVFVKSIQDLTDLEVVLVDERLSSKSADVLLGKRDKANRDAVAAMVILQTYLDNL